MLHLVPLQPGVCSPKSLRTPRNPARVLFFTPHYCQVIATSNCDFNLIRAQPCIAPLDQLDLSLHLSTPYSMPQVGGLD